MPTAFKLFTATLVSRAKGIPVGNGRNVSIFPGLVPIAVKLRLVDVLS